MATRRRDIAPRKDKKVPSPSHTPTTHLQATSNFPSKTNTPPQNHNPTAPRKNIPTSLKPTLRISANDVYKQQVIKKPTSIDTPHKPTHTTRRTFDKTPISPSQKTRVSTNPSIRDKTPLPAGKTHVSTNPSIRDKTPLPAQKRHVSTNPSVQIRDKTPLPAKKRHASTNPSRDKTPLPSQKIHVSTNPSIQTRDKTPLPARKTQVSTNPSIQTCDKTPLPARKAHITTSTTPSPRSSPISEKIIASLKTGPSKNSKSLNNDVGKRRSLHTTPMNTTLKTSSVFSKEQETEKSTTSATKEQITNAFQENVENSSIHQKVPEVEMLPEDQESCTVEAEEQIVQVVSNIEKGTVDLVPEDQEKPLDIVQIEIENDDDDDNDAKLVTNEPSPVLEQQEAPLDIKTQESEEKSCIEEKLEEEEEEDSVHEIDSNFNIKKSVANDYTKEETGEKEVHEEEEEEKEKVFDKKNEVAIENGTIKSMETKREVVENQKQEAKKQAGLKGKKDSVVSNDVIEETANKLREQRKNRVRALAGAFETVISLQ